MNEIENRKNLYGLGGWLVLFQIYIIMTVASSLQSIFLGLLMNSGVIIGYYKPYYYAFLAAAFVLALICMIFFYRKKIVFRTMFIVFVIVSLASSVTYALFGVDYTYYTTQLGQNYSFFASIAKGTSYVSLVISTGILIAFIIALYKSQRVKNTFS